MMPIVTNDQTSLQRLFTFWQHYQPVKKGASITQSGIVLTKVIDRTFGKAKFRMLAHVFSVLNQDYQTTVGRKRQKERAVGKLGEVLYEKLLREQHTVWTVLTSIAYLRMQQSNTMKKLAKKFNKRELKLAFALFKNSITHHEIEYAYSQAHTFIQFQALKHLSSLVSLKTKRAAFTHILKVAYKRQELEGVKRATRRTLIDLSKISKLALLMNKVSRETLHSGFSCWSRWLQIERSKVDRLVSLVDKQRIKKQKESFTIIYTFASTVFHQSELLPMKSKLLYVSLKKLFESNMRQSVLRINQQANYMKTTGQSKKIKRQMQEIQKQTKYLSDRASELQRKENTINTLEITIQEREQAIKKKERDIRGREKRISELHKQRSTSPSFVSTTPVLQSKVNEQKQQQFSEIQKQYDIFMDPSKLVQQQLPQDPKPISQSEAVTPLSSRSINLVTQSFDDHATGKFAEVPQTFGFKENNQPKQQWSKAHKLAARRICDILDIPIGRVQKDGFDGIKREAQIKMKQEGAYKLNKIAERKLLTEALIVWIKSAFQLDIELYEEEIEAKNEAVRRIVEIVEINSNSEEVQLMKAFQVWKRLDLRRCLMGLQEYSKKINTGNSSSIASSNNRSRIQTAAASKNNNRYGGK